MEINSQRPLAPMADRITADVGKAADRVAHSAAVPTQPGSNASPVDSTRVLQTQQANQQELRQAVDELQKKVQLSVSNLHFSIDNETGRTVVRVTDGATKEVIRQIPPEEILKLDKALDKMWGLLLNKKG